MVGENSDKPETVRKQSHSGTHTKNKISPEENDEFDSPKRTSFEEENEKFENPETQKVSGILTNHKKKKSIIKVPETILTVEAKTLTPSEAEIGIRPYEPPTAATHDLIYLLRTTGIYIKEDFDSEEDTLGLKTELKYQVFDNFHNRLFFAYQRSDPLCGFCVERNDDFTVQLKNKEGHVSLTFVKNETCCGACFSGNKVLVKDSNGDIVGTIEQTSVCTPKFSVYGPHHDTVLEIVGPKNSGACCYRKSWVCCCRRGLEVEFRIYIGATQVGRIYKSYAKKKKKISIVPTEIVVPSPYIYDTDSVDKFKDVDQFGIEFREDFHPALKGTLIGAVFLLDFLYYQHHDKYRKEEDFGGAGDCSILTAVCSRASFKAIAFFSLFFLAFYLIVFSFLNLHTLLK